MDWDNVFIVHCYHRLEGHLYVSEKYERIETHKMTESFHQFSAPVAGQLLNEISCTGVRVVIAVFGVTAAFGFGLAALCNQVTHVILKFG